MKDVLDFWIFTLEFAHSIRIGMADFFVIVIHSEVAFLSLILLVIRTPYITTYSVCILYMIGVFTISYHKLPL